MEWMVSLGPAKPGDAGPIAELLGRFDLPTAGIADHLENFIVARNDGQLVGSVGFERVDECVFLRSLAVDPAFRGRGLGRRLALEAIDRAIRQGLTKIYLLALADPAYFASMGFLAVTGAEFPAGFPEQQQLARGRCSEQILMLRNLG